MSTSTNSHIIESDVIFPDCQIAVDELCLLSFDELLNLARDLFHNQKSDDCRTVCDELAQRAINSTI